MEQEPVFELKLKLQTVCDVPEDLFISGKRVNFTSLEVIKAYNAASRFNGDSRALTLDEIHRVYNHDLEGIDYSRAIFLRYHIGELARFACASVKNASFSKPLAFFSALQESPDVLKQNICGLINGVRDRCVRILGAALPGLYGGGGE